MLPLKRVPVIKVTNVSLKHQPAATPLTLSTSQHRSVKSIYEPVRVTFWQRLKTHSVD